MSGLRQMGTLLVAIASLAAQPSFGESTPTTSSPLPQASGTAPSLVPDEVPCEASPTKVVVRHARRRPVRKHRVQRTHLVRRPIKPTLHRISAPRRHRATHRPIHRPHTIPVVQHCYVYHRSRLTRADLPLGPQADVFPSPEVLASQSPDVAFDAPAETTAFDEVESQLGGGGFVIGLGGGGGGGPTTVSATPEPGVWVLMIVGLALIGRSLRRRVRPSHGRTQIL